METHMYYKYPPHRPFEGIYTAVDTGTSTLLKKRTRRELPKAKPSGELPAVCGIKELAAHLGIGKNKAYELVNTGAIRSIRVGRQIRITKVAILEYLEGKK